MEHIGSLTLDVPALSAITDRANLGESISFPFAAEPGERGSEARRRFLFSAAHHGRRDEAHHSHFPGKLAWIAVALFIISVLIALIG